MNSDEIKYQLNEQNKKLLQTIEEFLPVRFELWDENYYGAKISKKENCGIVYCRTDLHQAKIAHELLHLKTGSLLGDDEVILSFVRKSISPQVYQIVSDSLCKDLLNHTEHYLMFEEYQSMGYNAIDFFESHSLQSEATQWINHIEKHGLGVKGYYTTNEIHSYIGLLILLYLYPIRGQYKYQIKKISKCIPSLAKIVKDFTDKLSEITTNSEDREKMEKAYVALATGLIEWITELSSRIKLI